MKRLTQWVVAILPGERQRGIPVALALAAIGLTPAAHADDAFYPSQFAQAQEITLDIPAGQARVSLPEDVAAAYPAAARVQTWRSNRRSWSSAVLRADPTPDDAFDDGSAPRGLTQFPLSNADQSVQSWFVTVEAQYRERYSVELLVGRDLNGDGLAQTSELACRSVAGEYETPRCLLDMRGKTGQPLWAFSHVLSGPYSEQVDIVFSAADFQLSAGGTKVDVAPDEEFTVARSGDDLGPGMTVDFSYRAGPDSADVHPTYEIGGLLLTQGDHALAGATLWPLRLDFTPQAHAGKAFALAARYDGFDVVKLSLQPGQTYDRLFADNPGQDVMILSLTGRDAAVTTWEETFPAASIDSLGSAAVPPPVGRVVVLDPDASPGAPHSIYVCGGCAGANYAIGMGRHRFVVRNKGDQATMVRLKVSLPRAVDFATRPLPGLYMADGNYYNPLRSGDGLFLDHVGVLQLVYWYTYDADGKPIWYVASIRPGIESDMLGNANAVLYRVDQVPFREAKAVGRIVLTRIGYGGHELMFSWSIDGESGTNRLILAAPHGCVSAGSGASSIAVSGHWFDPAAPGRGANLLGLGERFFGGYYFFDRAGAPRWVVGDFAPAGSGGRWSGDLWQRQGACPTCTYVAPTLVRAGAATFDFLSDGKATQTTNVHLVPPLDGQFFATTNVLRATDTEACAH